jgi:hypothetical protein
MADEEPWTALSRSDAVLLSRDITTAIKQLCDRPDDARRILSTLNHRLRPLGIRVELVGDSASGQISGRQAA